MSATGLRRRITADVNGNNMSTDIRRGVYPGRRMVTPEPSTMHDCPIVLIVQHRKIGRTVPCSYFRTLAKCITVGKKPYARLAVRMRTAAAFGPEKRASRMSSTARAVAPNR